MLIREFNESAAHALELWPHAIPFSPNVISTDQKYFLLLMPANSISQLAQLDKVSMRKATYLYT